MRYHLALWLYGIARHLNPDAGVSVTQFSRDGRHHVVVDVDRGHHIETEDEHSELSWPERDCAG